MAAMPFCSRKVCRWRRTTASVEDDSRLMSRNARVPISTGTQRDLNTTTRQPDSRSPPPTATATAITSNEVISAAVARTADADSTVNEGDGEGIPACPVGVPAPFDREALIVVSDPFGGDHRTAR